MKDFTKVELESGRPDFEPEYLIEFCLDRLYEDTVHEVMDDVVEGLMFEELIGALLAAKEK